MKPFCLYNGNPYTGTTTYFWTFISSVIGYQPKFSILPSSFVTLKASKYDGRIPPGSERYIVNDMLSASRLQKRLLWFILGWWTHWDVLVHLVDVCFLKQKTTRKRLMDKNTLAQWHAYSCILQAKAFAPFIVYDTAVNECPDPNQGSTLVCVVWMNSSIIKTLEQLSILFGTESLQIFFWNILTMIVQ